MITQIKKKRLHRLRKDYTDYNRSGLLVNFNINLCNLIKSV